MILDFEVREVRTNEEKQQLMEIFSEASVGIGYDRDYDKEYVVVDSLGKVFGGMQVNLEPTFKGQACKSYNIHNIGLAKKFRGHGLGTRLIKKLKNDAQKNKVDSITIMSSRASELASYNNFKQFNFKLFHNPSAWVFCLKDNCKWSSNCLSLG